MKATSLALMFMTCGVCWSQSGFSGTVMNSNFGVTIEVESKLEPSKPEMAIPGKTGLSHLEGAKPGMRRFSTNTTTHEYSGYDMRIEAIEKNGTYRVTFSALTLKPEDLKLPEPGTWRMVPPPLFPPSQIVSLADTIAVDVFESPATGQKIVDYIRFKRDNCEQEGAGSSQIDCLNGLVQDARRSLTEKLTQMENTRDPVAATSIKESQQTWEAYRNAACANLTSEVKRLQCELKLTRSRAHDLDAM